MNTPEEVADLLDELSRSFVRLADTLWNDASRRRIARQISRDEYEDVQANCRALLRRAVEIVTTASKLRLQQSSEGVERLKNVARELREATKRIERAQNIVAAALAAVAAVTLVVAAVVAPSPVTIGGAVGSVADFVLATAAAAVAEDEEQREDGKPK